MSEFAIEVSHLTFSYHENGPRILEDVSFSIKKGSYVTLIGHNGSGKSTLAKIIAGLYQETSYDTEIRIFDMKYDKEHQAQIHRLIGLVFQNPDNQFVGASVRDDIAFGLENRAIDPSLMEEIIVHAATSMGMEKYLDQAPENLSGGQKQRVALAGVFALSPSLLILDEATSMLDPKGKKEVLSYVQEMKKENPSLTVLSITHDVEESLLADQVLVMAKGKIILQGTPLEVFTHEEALKEANLDAPFAFELEKELRKEGMEIPSTFDLEKLKEILCQ